MCYWLWEGMNGRISARIDVRTGFVPRTLCACHIPNQPNSAKQPPVLVKIGGLGVGLSQALLFAVDV